MSLPFAAIARRAPGARRRTAAPRGRGEDGFILLESIVSLGLITIIVAALGTFSVNSVNNTNYLRARQGATQVATSAMTTIDTLPVSDLFTGRSYSAAHAQYQRGSALAPVAPYLATTKEYNDPSTTLAAGSGASATVSTSTQTTTLNGITYSVDTYVGTCSLNASTDCVGTGGSGTTYDRAVVWVQWQNRGCSGSTVCTFVTSTLVDPDDDPVFNTNRSTPPATPIVVNPGNQTSTKGGAVALTLAVKSGTGVNPMTWAVTAGSLPAGLILDGNTGTISGAPLATQAAASVTVTVTDAFTRTGSATFTWAVVAAPTITTPANQTSQVGTAASLSTTSTCPNTPCTYTASGLPAGLSINSSTGAISGTPTTAGTSSVTVTVTDAGNVSATTNAFTWTVAQARPTIADPGTQSVTIGQNVSVALAYTCPSTPCVVKLTGTIPPGVGLSTSATTTGNNTIVQSPSLTATSGTIYLAGTVQTSAVNTGAGSKTYAPILTITDSRSQAVTSATGAWTAYEAPTISTLAAKTVRTLETSSAALTYTCPIAASGASCSITLAGTVTGLGLATSAQTTNNGTTSLPVTATSGTIYYTGKVDSAAVSSGYTASYNPRITITDADGVAASTQATYTVNKAPAITNPGTQAMNAGQNLNLPLSLTCPNGGCTKWTLAYQIGNDPTYYPINGYISSAGVITYNNVPAATYSLRVGVTDSANQTDTIYFTLKAVSAISVSVPNQTTTKPSTGSTVVTLDASTLVNPTADGYTYSLSNAPSWLVIDPTTGLMTATVTSSSASSGTITLTVRSNASSTSAATTTFTWTLR